MIIFADYRRTVANILKSFPRVTKLAEIFAISSPSVFSRQSRHHRSLVRRASAARAILLANAASLYSSQQAVQAVPSQFVAKSGERDGSGASSRTTDNNCFVLSKNLPRFLPINLPSNREIIQEI